ncbi:MAG: hypothetical protein MNSN_09210 [Minisyncoccus archaeiphilus]|uniref:hypothetical protein n=1 Tax=Minisyncoccus archaeiphilus TaxID=3238481 RepID=UPI002B194D82|nr:MAG: hypothetical protein MNSN_09210 [Candidatus Parcubacteria bacterium]
MNKRLLIISIAVVVIVNMVFSYKHSNSVKQVGEYQSFKEERVKEPLSEDEVLLTFLVLKEKRIVKDDKEGYDFVSDGGGVQKVEKNGMDILFVRGDEQVLDEADLSISMNNENLEADILIRYGDNRIETDKGKYIIYIPEKVSGVLIMVGMKKSAITKVSLVPVDINQGKVDFSFDSKIDEDVRMAYSFNDGEYVKGEVLTVYGQSRLKGRVEREVSDDINNNKVNERYILKEGQLSVWEEGGFSWKSPDDWWIDDYRLADIDGKEGKEIVFSAWKSGSFGTSKPFWVEKDDMSVRNHLFVYAVDEGKVKSVWGSSNLPRPNTAFEVEDVDMDGKNELVVIEEDYADTGKDGGYVAVWKWNGWGFANEWRSDWGKYSSLDVVRMGERNIILVDIDRE